MDKTSIPKLHSIKRKDQGNVHTLELMTRHDLPVERVLMAAINARLKNVVIVGEFEDGTTYHAATQANMGEVFMALDMMKHHLLRIVEDE